MENETRKEIDLIDVIKNIGSSIGNLCKKAGKFFGLLLRLAYQEKWIVAAFTIAGILLGFFLSKNKIYRAEAEMRINLHDVYYYKNMVDPLYNQCKYRKWDAIAQDLNLPEEKAKSIINIQSFFYIDDLIDGTPNKIDYDNKFNPQDTLSAIMSDRLRIVIDCTDSTLFSTIDSCFKYFFLHNDQIVKENCLRKKQLDERILAIEEEKFILDSMRKKEYFKTRESVQLSTDKMVLVERERKLYHNEILHLENQRQQLIWERDVCPDGILFTSKFEMNPHPRNFWIKQCAIFGVIFLLLGLFVATLKIRRQKIQEYLNKTV